MGNIEEIYGASMVDCREGEGGKLIYRFTDDITAYDKTKKAVIHGKGETCCMISAIISKVLNDNGIKTHFIKNVSHNELLCERVDYIPLKFLVRNRISGSLMERLGLEKGMSVAKPIVELYYQNAMYGNPFVNKSQVIALGLVNEDVLERLYEKTMKANEVLTSLFDKAGLSLVDFKLRFAKLNNGEIVVSNFINPDNSRFWDKTTDDSLDKDRFREDRDKVGESYKQVLNKLTDVLK